MCTLPINMNTYTANEQSGISNVMNSSLHSYSEFIH